MENGGEKGEGNGTKGEEEMAFFHLFWLTPKGAGVGPGQNHGPGTPSLPPRWVARMLVFGTSAVAAPGASAGSWLGNSSWDSCRFSDKLLLVKPASPNIGPFEIF